MDICPHGAINLEARPKEARIEVDAVLLAPGFAVFDATRVAEYGWGRCSNVVTSLEFECMLSRSGPTGGDVLRPSDGRPPAASPSSTASAPATLPLAVPTAPPPAA